MERKLAAGDRPDYISLAGSGEPTLNADIGRLMERIKALTDVPVAVLTNGSLLWRSDVQADLMPADLVLPSLDAGDERLFQYVNRPHRDIAFDRMVEGIAAFNRRFQGEVWLEVLLLAGVTGLPFEVRKIAALAARIGASRVQLTTTCRPPAEDFACPLSLKQLEALKGYFDGRVDLIGPGNSSASRNEGHLRARGDDVLALLSRRPCTSDDVARGLDIHLNAALKHLESLVADGRVNVVATGGRHFYTAEGPPEMAGGQRT